MIPTPILGVAAGTGFALLVAMTIVVYRYYTVKRKIKYWSNLDRWPDPPSSRKNNRSRNQRESIHLQPNTVTASDVLDCWRKQHKSYYAVQIGFEEIFVNSNYTPLYNAWKLKSVSSRRRLIRVHKDPSSRYLSNATLDTLVKVPEKLSEVLGDVLDLACGGGAKSSRASGGTAANKASAATSTLPSPYRWAQKVNRSSLSSATNTDSSDSTSSSSSQELNIPNEQPACQSAAKAESGGLPRQARSYPGGSVASSSAGGSFGRLFGRNSSVSSTSSLEGAASLSSHRTPSPRIRTYTPDGRYQSYRDPCHSASAYPSVPRSPSPGRSCDGAYGSPSSYSGSLSHNVSTSQSSLCSLATGISSSLACSSSSLALGDSRTPGRNLLPLHIPPFRSGSEGGPAPPASPLGTLQPDLYQPRDTPICIRAHRSSEIIGRLRFLLKYDFDRSDFLVHLIEIQHLPTGDNGGFNEPYVILTLVPQVDNRKRQTDHSVNKPTLSFDQLFKFPVSYDKLQDRNLIFQVLDHDRFSRNDIFGTVTISMEHIDLAAAAYCLEVLSEIEKHKKPPEHTQQVRISLSYLPSAGRLTVRILEARNLYPTQDRQSLDCFVKVCLLCGEKRPKKKRTQVKKGTTSPSWDESMTFKVPQSSLNSSAIEICVIELTDLTSGNEIVGSCIVGATAGTDDPNNEGRKHWMLMTNSPRESITMWHILR